MGCERIEYQLDGIPQYQTLPAGRKSSDLDALTPYTGRIKRPSSSPAHRKWSFAGARSGREAAARRTTASATLISPVGGVVHAG